MIQIPPVFILGPGKFEPGFSQSDIDNVTTLFEAHDIPCLDPTYLDGPVFREGIEAIIYSQEITAHSARINLIISGVAAIAVLPDTFKSFAGMAQLFTAKALGVNIIDLGNGAFSDDTAKAFWNPISLADFVDGANDLR